ncbi:hypothetical protein [Actinopolyspora mortivallis]|nr:hypothetical protein [Actinopolyspora mortivallis]
MNESAVSHQRSVYLDDTYTTEVVTRVIARGVRDERRWLAVRDNIVHPQGGGQPSDVTSLNGIPSTVVRDPEGEPLVALAPDEPMEAWPEIGERVTVSVDRARRLENAALHTAGHLVDAAVRLRDYKHIVSNHFPGQARIEFEATEPLTDAEQFVAAVQSDVDTVVEKNLDVAAYWADGRRYVRIGDFSLDECAGTHVSNLREIRDLLVRSAKVKKGRLKVGYTASYSGGSDR